jgi:alpha-glucosidase (family GH31 glycosyl hydrolase)
MREEVTRRKMLSGLGAGAAHLLLRRQFAVASVSDSHGGTPNTGTPGKVDLSLIALSTGTLQISVAPFSAEPPVHELGIVDRSRPTPLEKTGISHPHAIAWGQYDIQVNENPLRITVSERSGKVRQFVAFDTNSMVVRFGIGSTPLFGLGAGGHPFDRRGTKDSMMNGQHAPDLGTYGARLPIPWLISPEGWGLFIGQPSGDFDLSGNEGAFYPVEASSTRNVFLVLGDTPADLLREYAGLTGFPHMPPLWALGFQQSHRTLSSREEILSEAKTFRTKKLPCDAMVYLGTGFCPSGWNTGHGSFTFNDAVFPDPVAMFEELHADHFKIILHVVPPGDLHGTVEDTDMAAGGPGDAVTYWAKHIPVERTGVDGWWPDEGDRLSTYARLERNQMYWEGSVKLHPDRRPFALHRNGYAGLQRYGWLWSGDVDSTWQTLRAQVAVGTNVGLSGIPFWGTDTGGFLPTKELTPELYVRWFQFSSFCPSFRAHGRAWKLRLPWGWNLGEPGPKEVEGAWTQNWPRESDLHRPDVEDICRKYLNLRYQLLAYLYSTVAQAHATGLPLMRPLWVGYPTDLKAALIDDAYLWGDSFLVAPVYEKDASQRTTYLPPGTWWDYWSGEKISGGRELTRKVDLATMPLYVRAGSIIPIAPLRQYTSEAPGEPVILRIYPGADGKFTWYDDDGSSFRYETGEYLRVECEWRDNQRLLTLTRDPNGRFAAGLKFQTQLHGEERTRNVSLEDGITRVQL